jgi:hypothetical protein
MINRHTFVLFSAVLPIALVLALPRVGAAQDASSEPDFLSLWAMHRNTPQAHESLSVACATFKRSHGTSPFRPVSDCLRAWHMLAASKTNDAIRVFRTLARSNSAGGLDRAARDVACAWLSRIDREAVRSALEAEYVKHVEYPESLDVLAALPNPPPLKDRWGRAWIYRQRGFNLLSGLQGQRYMLESAKLKPETDLRKAMARPYGAGLKLTLVREISKKAGSEIAEVEIESDSSKSSVVLSLGSSKRGLTYAYRGKGFMIFADDYWHVFGTRK